MKSMNKRESKKIAVMAAIIMGLMMFAFMPMASAGVTSFTVTPSSGVVGAVDSYNVLVTTTGVNTLNISIPAGFIAVRPATGGVEIARVDFWNTSTKAYYGYGTVTANNANPLTEVDVYCKMQVGGDEIEVTKTEDVSYNPGGISTFQVDYPEESPIGTAMVRIVLPTENDNGCINITIDCPDIDLLEDVHIAIGQFVRNPLNVGFYDFIADGVTDSVLITGKRGCGAVFRSGYWFVDKDGDHTTDIYFKYGILDDIPVVGDINDDGSGDAAIFRDGWWWVSNAAHTGTDYTFKYGIPGDKPVVGDINGDGIDDAAIFRDGWWWVSNADHTGTDYTFKYGAPGDTPVVGDITGDGIDDVAVRKGGFWFVSNADHTGTDSIFWYGIPSDKPVVSDVTGDGIDDVAVLRNGWWWVCNQDRTVMFPGTDYNFKYGITGDLPVVSDII